MSLDLAAAICVSPSLLLIAEQDNLIGQTVHLIGVMANENDGDPSVAKILHQALDVSARRGVEPCTWFVQHQHRRIAGDDSGDGDQPLLAA